jgi:hypothetical protein
MIRFGRAAVIVASSCLAMAAADRVVILQSSGALPAHLTGMFREPMAYARAADGSVFVFDRRAHAVYRIEAGGSTAHKIVTIGSEEGRLLEPSAFDLAPNGSFVVADGPNGRERVQIFTAGGERFGGFTLPGRNAARLTIGDVVLSGVGSLDYTGRSILISQPETGALLTEYTLSGRANRTIGRLRATGQEADRDVHLALNGGVPLAAADDGFYFVFMAGVPMFRRYSPKGDLQFERHIEGPELDALVRAVPTTWSKRRVDPGGELPLVPPTVRAAAVAPDGRLWIAFVLPYVYVYDEDGDKVQTLQLRGAGIIAPNSLFFAGPDRLLVTPGCYEFTTR